MSAPTTRTEDRAEPRTDETLGGLVHQLSATAILGLALVVDGWLAALIVAIVLFAGAGVAALVGKKEVAQATPPAPERAIAGVREDVATLKGGRA